MDLSVLPIPYAYLFEFRHNMQHATTRMRSTKHATDMAHKAICTGSPASHQNSVDGGNVGTSTPTTVGMYCVQKADSVCR